MPLPRHRIVYESLLFFRYNSMTLSENPAVRYRLRLYNKSGALWEDCHFGVGFQPTVNWAQTRLGPVVTIKPLGFLSFSGGYFYNLWYGALGSLRSYASVDSNYFLADNFDNTPEDYSSSGHEAYVGAKLTFVLGPIVFADTADFYWTKMSLNDGDLVYYQPIFDIAVENGSWFLSNDADLGFITPFGLTVAVRTSVVHAFYSAAVAETASARAGMSTPTVRLGPLLTYTFFDESPRRFNKPTLMLMTSWWLRNRFRTGDEVGAGVPFVLLAFRFEGDIWWRD